MAYKTKPFDLKEALAGAKVVTRAGREVTQLVLFHDVETVYPLKGVSEGMLFNWDGDGNFYKTTPGHYMDLFLGVEPVTKEGWINLYKASQSLTNPEGVTTGVHVHESEDDAKSVATLWRYLTTVKVTWEEEV